MIMYNLLDNYLKIFNKKIILYVELTFLNIYKIFQKLLLSFINNNKNHKFSAIFAQMYFRIYSSQLRLLLRSKYKILI